MKSQYLQYLRTTLLKGLDTRDRYCKINYQSAENRVCLGPVGLLQVQLPFFRRLVSRSVASSASIIAPLQYRTL